VKHARSDQPRRGIEGELLLEAGMLAFAAGLAVGLGALLMGRATGNARRAARRAEGPPSWGSVSSQRHQNIATAAAR
jgi:hypothetical protein